MTFEGIDWKLVAAVVSPAIGIVGFVPYFLDIFKKKTKPHLYTWLIWTLTLGLANASIFHGGGGAVLSIGIAINVLLCLITVIISFWYGTKNITRSDTITFIAAIVAIFVWVGLNNPVAALFLGTAIDLVGYWPTYRKSFIEPWSENLTAWILYVIAPALTLFSLMEYNILTVTYSIATLAANTLLIALLLIRRKTVAKPQ